MKHNAIDVFFLLSRARNIFRNIIEDIGPCSCREGYTARRVDDPDCEYHGWMHQIEDIEKWNAEYDGV